MFEHPLGPLFVVPQGGKAAFPTTTRSFRRRIGIVLRGSFGAGGGKGTAAGWLGGGGIVAGAPIAAGGPIDPAAAGGAAPDVRSMVGIAADAMTAAPAAPNRRRS